MSNKPKIGNQLYALFPEVYRNRDNSVRDGDGKIIESGDLARFLLGTGDFLESIKQTLDQFLADSLPGQGLADAFSSQPWVLPYLADLLDASLVSPEPEGQRVEIENAVSWRQGKGTLRVLEEIAEAVGQVEVEIQEGWQRLALTPRIGSPLLPATVYGETEDINVEHEPPSRVARHPGLPSVTIDFRRASRAVQCEAGNPAANRTNFDGDEVYWRLANLHGAPCFPDSYEDASRRTVDLRTPDWRRGHFHPRRVLLYLPPPVGFFHNNQGEIRWQDRDLEANESLLEMVEATRVRDGVEESLVTYRGLTDKPLVLNGVVAVPTPESALADVYRFENVVFTEEMTVSGTRAEFRECAVNRVWFEGAVGAELDLRDCLVGTAIANGPVLMEFCTILNSVMAPLLQASDCIFVGGLMRNETSPPEATDSCIRYSALPKELSGFEEAVYPKSCTGQRPQFYTDVFGRMGCGVLHPSSPDAIWSGAEDGGEMGAFHHQHFCRRWDAVQDKQKDFLPIRQKNTLIPDSRLLCAPPKEIL